LIVIARITARQGVRPTNITPHIIFFSSLLIVNGLVNDVSIAIILPQFVIYIKGLIFFFVFVEVGINEGYLHDYLFVFFWIGVVFLFSGFVDFIAPERFRAMIGNVTPVEYRNNLPSATGLFPLPLGFGWFMAYLSLFCFAYFMKLKKMPYLLMGVVFFSGCFIAQRLKSIVGLIAGILISLFLISSRTHLKMGLIIFICFVLIMIFMLPLIVQIVQLKMTPFMDSEKVNDIARYIMYLTSIDIANDFFPFGAGIGRFGSHLSAVYYSPIYELYGLSTIHGMTKEDHNFLLDTFWPMILGETGWIGLLVYSLMIIVIFRTLVRYMNETVGVMAQAFQLGTIMMLSESLVESIAEPIFTAPPLGFFVFGAIGISYALHYHSVHTLSAKSNDIGNREAAPSVTSLKETRSHFRAFDV
jgi:hypothetical protein